MSPEQLPQRWDFYLRTRNGIIASVALNLALGERGADARRPEVTWVKLTICHPSPNGLSTTEERPRLNAIEDRLTAFLFEGADAIFAGRVMSEGYWTFAFYHSGCNPVRALVHTAMASFPEYAFEIEEESDPEWASFFRVLWPTKLERQCMMNRGVLQRLQREGDDLSAQRDVRHWIYFPHSFGRQQFIDSLAGAGFTTSEHDLPDDGRSEHRFCVQIWRDDHVDPAAIDALVCQLVERAQEFGGDYDGWETQVLKPDK